MGGGGGGGSGRGGAPNREGTEQLHIDRPALEAFPPLLVKSMKQKFRRRTQDGVARLRRVEAKIDRLAEALHRAGRQACVSVRACARACARAQGFLDCWPPGQPWTAPAARHQRLARVSPVCASVCARASGYVHACVFCARVRTGVRKASVTVDLARPGGLGRREPFW